jgi:hypothetical protein
VIQTPQGQIGNVALLFIARPRRRLSLHPPDATPTIPHVFAGIEASRRARIPSPPVEPAVLVLCLNQVTRRFCGEPPQTSCADFGCEPLPCTGSCLRLRLAFLATMRLAPDPPGHWVP